MKSKKQNVKSKKQNVKSKKQLIHRRYTYLVACSGLLLLILLFSPELSHAQEGVLGDWDRYLGGVPGFEATSQTGEELAVGFIRNLVAIVRTLVGGIALIMGIFYGLRLVLARGQEEALSKQRTNFLWLLMGFVVLIIAENVASIFNPATSTADSIIDFNATRDQFRDIVDYIKWLLGSVIVLWMSIVSFRMVTAGDDEEAINTQKKNLTWGMMGIMVILLANNIVNAIYVINGPDEVTAAPTEASISELTSLIRLILVFLGPIAVIFTIYAGFLYLTALDNEDRAGTAKKMIVAGIVAIVIIYGAYALVNTFVSADLALLIPTLIT